MKISECMTRDVKLASPDEKLREVAHVMADEDCGILPVGEQDRLVGIITDRDIAIQGIGTGKGPDAKVRDVMSPEIKYCFEDDDAEDILRNMDELQVRRLPVVNRNKRLVGIISISDLAKSGETTEVGEALAEITQPSKIHSQTV